MEDPDPSMGLGYRKNRLRNKGNREGRDDESSMDEAETVQEFVVNFEDNEILVGVTLDESIWGGYRCAGKIGFTIA